MRQIVLDTETTGLNPRTGDRVIEVGCVELVNRRLTGNNFHRYINPERDSEFLSDKPKFAEIATELCAYLQGAQIIIHNAPFDIGFLDAEFDRLKLSKFDKQVNGHIDTLKQAKEMHPGKRNSLDALCDRYGISNSHRTLHGALLDAELLAEVYLAMTRGQNSLVIDHVDEPLRAADGQEIAAEPMAEIIVLQASAEELTEHEAMLDKLDKEAKGRCVWRSGM
jgi:DNA polymerase-3 subunit epsilon